MRAKFFCQRKELQLSKGECYTESCGGGLESEISLRIRVFSYVYSYTDKYVIIYFYFYT